MMCRLSPEVKAINCGVIRDHLVGIERPHWTAFLQEGRVGDLRSLCLSLALLSHADRRRRCPLIGEDQKWLTQVQTGVIDPTAASATEFAASQRKVAFRK
jgi:hypothetical protein